MLFSARTDIGRSREHNEDNFLVDRRFKLYIVCDGLGGHHGGEIASATAVNVVREHVREHRELLEIFADETTERPEVLQMLTAAVHLANERIHERGRLAQMARGMGTTLSLFLVVGTRGYIAHVGDTRIYRLQADRFDQITDDHSLINEMQRGLKVSAATMEAVGDKIKNQITRAVGVNPTVEVDVASIELRDGDRFLLASDGLHGPVPDPWLHEVMELPVLDAITARFIELANDAGGPDNITAVVLQIGISQGEAIDPSLTLTREAFGAARSHSLFRGFHDAEVARVCDGAERMNLAPREMLFEFGTQLSGMFILLRGDLVLQDPRNPTGLKTLVQGSIVAEEALLVDRSAPYRAAASRHGPAQLAYIPRAIFLSSAVQKPLLLLKVAQGIASLLASRLEHAAATTGALGLLSYDPATSEGPSTRPQNERPALLPHPPTGIGLRPGQQRAAVSSKPPGSIPTPTSGDRPRAPERPHSEPRSNLTLPAIPSIRSPGLSPSLPPPLPGADLGPKD